MGAVSPAKHRWWIALATVAVVGAGIALAHGGATEVHPLPPPGEVATVTLAHERPAFLVHHRSGDVSAFDARSPVGEPGQRGLLSWCGPNGVFVDPLHGHSWHPDGAGRVLRGTTPRSDRARDDPPPAMVALPVEATDRLARFDVDAPATPHQPPTDHPPPFAPSTCDPDDALRPALPGTAVSLAELTPPAGEVGVGDGVYRLRALLEQQGGEPPRLCAVDADECAGRGWQLSVPASPHLAAGLTMRYRGELAISVRDGQTVEVILGDVGARRISRRHATVTGAGDVSRRRTAP